MNRKSVIVILSTVLLAPIFIGCGLFDDNSRPTIEPITDQMIATDSKKTVEFYITDDDDDDTHTVNASSANASIATVSVNEGDLNTFGTVDLTITGIAVGSTTVIVSVTDDSGQDNATAELVFAVTIVEPQVVASTPSPLMESSLDGSTVTLTLIGFTYRWGGVTVSGIDGVTLDTTRRISDTEITVVLRYNYTDFDTDSTLNITVNADAIEEDYSGPPLTAEIPVIADLVAVNGPWLWMAVPTDPNAGGGVSTEIDSLAEASNNKTTEVDVAENSVNEGEIIGEFQWTSGSIKSKRAYTCKEFCSFGIFGIGSGCADLCWLDNIKHLFSVLGFRAGNDLNGYTAYALINIVSSSNQDNASIHVESSDAIKVWLNGEIIDREAATVLGCRSVDVPVAFDPTVCTPDPSSNYDPSKRLIIPVNLKSGDNLLLVKVRQHGDYWGVIVKLAADFSTEIPKR